MGLALGTALLAALLAAFLAAFFRGPWTGLSETVTGQVMVAISTFHIRWPGVLPRPASVNSTRKSAVSVSIVSNAAASAFEHGMRPGTTAVGERGEHRERDVIGCLRQ